MSLAGLIMADLDTHPTPHIAKFVELEDENYYLYTFFNGDFHNVTHDDVASYRMSYNDGIMRAAPVECPY